MNPKAQRVAIAQSRGWTELRYERRVFVSRNSSDEPLLMGTSPQGYKNHLPPDYLNDLNAIHRIEKSMLQKDRMEYSLILAKIIGNNLLTDGTFADAPQRCEALLKLHNLWDDSK